MFFNQPTESIQLTSGQQWVRISTKGIKENAVRDPKVGLAEPIEGFAEIQDIASRCEFENALKSSVQPL